MGIDTSSIRFLLSARRLGLNGNSICTLGRQATFVKKSSINSLLDEYGIKNFVYPDKAYCTADDFLNQLGFTVKALDFSDYEGADIIHDLNASIGDDLRGKFDIVWDGGTLEHVFNFPTAIQNAMDLLKVGGHLFLETPANNQCGHGFYQFSPELFFRLLTPKNGFELVRLYITCKGKAYHVVDPIDVHGRVELLNAHGTMLKVHARKIADVPLSPIQQSDYVDDWQLAKLEKADGKLKGSLRKRLSDEQIQAISKLLNRLRIQFVVWRWKWNSRLSNKSLYIPVTNWNVPSRDQLR